MISEEEKSVIQLGDHVIIQRQKYTKLFKFNSLEAVVTLGNDQIELRNIVDLPYCSTFKMIPQESRKKKVFSLELCTNSVDLKDLLQTKESGTDNRNILDDGRSQGLSSVEIEKLRETCTSSTEIVGQLVENSKTFGSKTEYAQEKYLAKKEKKYFEYIQIKLPTVRLLTEIFYRQDPDKILGVRMDTLSQIISYSGVCGNGSYLLYESGTNGLLPAALLNSIGANTDGTLIHMHPGNVPQKQALQAINFTKEQLNRCISVNLYSVLRENYQNDEPLVEEKENSEMIENSTKRKHSDSCDIIDEENPAKQLKIDNKEPVKVVSESNNTNQTPKWKLENARACAVLKDKVDGLVIVAKENPSEILKALLPFVKSSRPIVIFSLSRELLMEMYVELKALNEVTGLRLTSNWMRMYQILPNRTHPDVNMNANSGFLLVGYVINN